MSLGGVGDARARRDAVWPCAGVAAGQRVHAPLGVPWELWVWIAWLVSEAPRRSHRRTSDSARRLRVNNAADCFRRRAPLTKNGVRTLAANLEGCFVTSYRRPDQPSPTLSNCLGCSGEPCLGCLVVSQLCNRLLHTTCSTPKPLPGRRVEESKLINTFHSVYRYMI